MGNMAYPVVTRLGINQFWYKHWYSDTSYNFSLRYRQSLLFKHLFKMYLNYGFTFETSVFFHEIFFNRSFKAIRKLKVLKNLKYFRRFFFTCERLSIEHSYYLRYRTGEYFPLRIWTMSWSRWFIISFNFFKPIKEKKVTRTRLPRDHFAVAPHLRQDISTLNLKRFKLLFIFLKQNTTSRGLTYIF